MDIYAYIHIYTNSSEIINNEIVCYNYDKIRKVGKENEKISQETGASMRDHEFKETFTLLCYR